MISLSFDTDRMDEARMRDFLAETPIPGRATFFCTQRYESLEMSNHELAPHAYLGAGSDWDVEIAAKRREFPDAVGWRSHSCVFSHLLAEQLADLGYRYVSVHDEPGVPDIQPVRHAWGLWHLPIYYMDNMDFSERRFWGEQAAEPFRPEVIETAISGDGLYVFGLHPIHLALNSPSAEEYFMRRDRLAAGEPISEIRFKGRGTLTFYLELVDAMESVGIESVAMADALTAHTAPTRSRE